MVWGSGPAPRRGLHQGGARRPVLMQGRGQIVPTQSVGTLGWDNRHRCFVVQPSSSMMAMTFFATSGSFLPWSMASLRRAW